MSKPTQDKYSRESATPDELCDVLMNLAMRVKIGEVVGVAYTALYKPSKDGGHDSEGGWLLGADAQVSALHKALHDLLDQFHEANCSSAENKDGDGPNDKLKALLEAVGFVMGSKNDNARSDKGESVNPKPEPEAVKNTRSGNLRLGADGRYWPKPVFSGTGWEKDLASVSTPEQMDELYALRDNLANAELREVEKRSILLKVALNTAMVNRYRPAVAAWGLEDEINKAAVASLERLKGKLRA